MASWAALNNAGAGGRDAGLAQRATQEAQDADNAALYEQALRCQQRKQNAQAKEIYASLLNGNAAVSVRLEYLCHKNLASMELEAQSFEHALQYFSKALELDKTDVVVWHQLATTAVETGKLWLARRALEEGFKVDSTYWPLVQTLAEVLAEIGDVDEYERVARYIRERDPQCASVKILDRKKKVKRSGKEERRAQKRLDHLHEVVETAKKKRRVLVQERKDELEERMRSRKFALQQPTWPALGKVLLEAFEENNRDEHADVVRTEVEIHAGFDELEEKQDVEMECGEQEEEEMQKQLDESEPPAKRPKHKVAVEASTALETSLSTGVSDNDTPNSASLTAIQELLQPRRRKSRRNEERLREEHAAAVKKAREKDLAYRLGAFLPAAVGDEERESLPDAVAMEWLPPLNIELVDAEFRVSDANKEIISKVASFAFPSSSEGAPSNVETQAAQKPASDQDGQAMAYRVKCVTTRQISAFIGGRDAAKAPRRGVLDWMRHFLNQCGEWAHVKLGSDDEDIHRVCAWLEKALNGDLDAAKATTPRQSSAINVADHSLAQGSRFEGNGLALGAQLFMLELHFDVLLQQPIRGKRRRKMRRQVEVQLAQAQKLLFEFGWLEDSEDGTPRPSRDEFLRLLWLIARMYERCGNPQMAQHYFIKCREKFMTPSEEDGASDDLSSSRIDLPNQKTENQISLEILDEKISGLRFSDVCSEARRLFEAGDHDSVVSTLLGYFFPASQAPRLSDFLQEFEADEDDTLARSGGSKKLSEMVLESLGRSPKFSDLDTVLFLLTALYYVVEFLDGLSVRKESSLSEDSPDEECTNALAAMAFLLTELTQTRSCWATNPGHELVLRGLCVRCLQPSILLRFDAPNDVLSMIRTVLEDIKAPDSNVDSTAQMIGVDAMARLFYTVRSLSSDDFRNLITLVPHPVKRKQPRRDRIRAVLVELLRFLNRAFRSNEELALLFPQSKRAAVMALCCTLMKEEEEMLTRSDGKTPKQLFGNGAILFVLLYVSLHRQNPPALPTQLVDLIQLLHERLGQHGICGMAYCADTGSSADASGSACFLESCTLLLSKFVKQKASVRDEEAFPRKADESSADESNEDEDGEDAEYRFQREVCQCYRCLYDVQILPGCDDHKTGASFALLQNAGASVKHEDALRLARFAVPILLATTPKNNGQKKERLKLLYAVREALSDSGFAALSAQPTSVSPSLEAYLAPRGLLQEDVTPPLPFDAGTAAAKSADEACLDHVWYLLGANFILGRVKRRGNLGELSEMEQHVRERVEFLMKDVLYYHPDRIDSWIRLGKTMKELYHAATDAFAAVLGQKRRIRAFQWYTTKVLAKDPADGNATNVFSFQHVVLSWNLFKTIKDWQGKDADAHKAGSKTANSKNPKEDSKESAQQVQPLEEQPPIEEYATAYIVQVIEFARRCFDMAARLAEEAAGKHQLKLQGERSSANTAASDGEDAFDEELDELQNKIIECNEESGLLLYNVLQELSLMKEVNLALFPHVVYSHLTRKALAYFRRGLQICEANDDAHEKHFRLQYMIGKTLRKRRWIELREQSSSDPEALSTAEEIAEFFAKAEASREEGDREHALVHAFYSLQALRIDLTISELPSISALRLVCKHFYEEEEGGDDHAADASSAKGAGETSKTQEDTVPTGSSATKDASAKEATSPSDTGSANSTKKDEILALLSDAESDDSVRDLNVTVARGWLALNIVEALESIPDEDRYFHPSRYVLARIVYWLSTFYSALDQSGYNGNEVTTLLEAVQARRSEEQVEGPSDAAARALKEMGPIFDKRRPQIVAIWFSEYIPVAKKFEELNQRQMKYDYYRLKYWRFYVALLEENADYGKLKEVGSWVLACKEEHDVIDMMLGIVLHARGKVLRRRLQEFLNAIEDAGAGRAVGGAMNMTTQTQLLPGEDRPVDALLKQLAKTYSYYLEVSNAQQRLARVMDDSGLLLENAELPMVAVFFVGAIAYPSEMPLLERNAAILDRDFNGNVTVIKNALKRDELPPRIYDAQNREAWKAYLDAARSFCEEKWPERSGKGKASKKHSRPKASGAASTEASQSTVDGSSQ